MTTYSSDRRPGARPALDQVQVLARALEIGLRTEVRHVDDERVALPVAARVAVPLADVGRQMRASVHDDVALPALALAHVVEDRDAARRLHDPAEAAGRRLPNSGSPPVRQRSANEPSSGPSLRFMRAGVVARRRFRKSRRGRRIVFAAAARRLLVLAGLGRLQQGETKFPLGGGDLLRLRRQRRNPAIGRIDDQRRARAGALDGHEHVVVGAGDVALGPALRTLVAAEQRRSLLGPIRRAAPR